VNTKRLVLPRVLAWPIVAAGMLAVFATYWDEAWHTDVGRDSAVSAPHVLLYCSVAVVGLGIAAWGIRVLLAARSLWAAVGHPPLRAAGVGATTTLLAGGIDIAWHAAYGRDAVLWSPPHMLALFGTVALTLGVVNGVASEAIWLRLAGAVLLLANAVAVVFEYEADVPQFTEVLYLPILLAAALVVAVAIDRLVPRTGAVSIVVAGYAVTRVAVMTGLASLGRSTPDLPIAVLGLAAWDLPFRSRVEKAAAAATGVAWFAWLASATGLASPAADSVAITVVPVSAVFALVMLRRLAPRATAAAAVFALGGMLAVADPEPASAHDPGQGRDIGPISLSAEVTGRQISLTGSPEQHCDDMNPQRMVARRAGEQVTGALNQVGAGCEFNGTLEVPAEGRWFTYVEFTHDGKTIEAWLPLIAGEDTTVTESRILYEPAGAGDGLTGSQVVFGGLIYLLGGFVVAVALGATRWTRQVAPAP